MRFWNAVNHGNLGWLTTAPQPCTVLAESDSGPALAHRPEGLKPCWVAFAWQLLHLITHFFAGKKKSQFQTKIYWSITMTANIRSSSPNKKSSGNIPRDKISSSAPFSATLEVHFKLSTLRMFWHRLRKKMRIFPISSVFFFKEQFSILCQIVFPPRPISYLVDTDVVLKCLENINTAEGRVVMSLHPWECILLNSGLWKDTLKRTLSL